MRVFISYCGEAGKALATVLRDKLNAEKEIDAWTYADPDYTIGERAWDEIYRQIVSSDWMVVLNTECTQGNRNQRHEWRLAMDQGVKVAVFSKEGVATPDTDLNRRNRGYFNESNFDDRCGKLIADLEKLEQEVGRLAERRLQDDRAMTDELLKSIRQRTEGLDSEKVRTYRNRILDDYLAGTLIRRIVGTGLVSENETGLMGTHVWLEVDAEEFKRGDVDHTLVCGQIADAIVRAEHKHLLRQLIKSSSKRTRSYFTKSSQAAAYAIAKQLDVLVNNGYRPDVILAPLRIYSEFMRSFHETIHWDEKGDQLLIEDSSPLTIYWSHGETPSGEFVIFDRRAVRWKVRPDEEDGALATAIGVSPLYRDRISFYAETQFKVEVPEPAAITVLTIP